MSSAANPAADALFAVPANPSLADRFVIPPFSLLDARQGYWQDRKRGWLSLGIQSEVGRTARAYNDHEWVERVNGAAPAAGDGTSIFDPVLCEVVYRWFARPGAQVVDPFAGGSVRGVVAAHLGLRYWGSELRDEQVVANRDQADTILTSGHPTWVTGDAAHLLPTAPSADLLFTCPPYGDLEVYSDDPADLSNMGWGDFLIAYREIIARACSRLNDDRFAAIVVGDFRDPRTGTYREFPAETTAAFKAAGLRYYNEAVLITPVGSLAIRTGKQFTTSRKLGRMHQNVLVFVKGDERRAAAYSGDVAGAIDTAPAPDDQLALFTPP